MGKIRKEKLGDKANEYNFFDVTYQNNGLMQPIQQEEKTTRSGKIFSPEKLIRSREEKKQENLTASSSKSSLNLDSSSDEQNGFKVTLSAATPKSKNNCSNFKGFSTSTETDKATKAIEPSLKKGSQSQERKKQGNVSSNCMKSFLAEDSSDEEIGIKNSKESSKKVCRNFKGFQSTTLENEAKTTKSLSEKSNLVKGNKEQDKATKIYSSLDSSDEEITFKDPIMKSKAKLPRNVNSSPGKEKRRTDSTSPLRRSPRKSVQLQRKVIFLCAYIF